MTALTPREQPAVRLLHALEQTDELAVLALLHPAVRLTIDAADRTGGRAQGRASVAGILAERLTRHPDASLEPADVNGEPGLALRRSDGVVTAVLGLATDPRDRVTELWLSTAPAKLTHWNRRPSHPGPLPGQS